MLRAPVEEITRFQTRKTGALLAYLAFHGSRPVTREILGDLLWPDHDPDAARNSLRVALNSLRRQLEPPGVAVGSVLVANRMTVQLSPDMFSTDVADFESALREEKSAESEADRISALERAVEVYRGPLLSGWYQEWIDIECARLGESYAAALRRLMAALTTSGEYERALEYALHAVRLDPLREEMNRNLMRLYAVLGQGDAAREQYERLELLLGKQTGRSPSSATRELLKQIAAREGASLVPLRTLPGVPGPKEATLTAANELVRSTVYPAPRRGVPAALTRFFGREAEIKQLIEMLRPRSIHRLVTLTGPGGSGKTRVAMEVAALLGSREYPERTWFVLLTDSNDAGIPAALLAALDLTPQPNVSPLDQVSTALRGMPALLVLDNLEQIADAAASWATDLLSAIPNLKILSTSRQRLSVGGEQEFFIPPFSPPTDSVVSPEFLIVNPCVALFLDRARAVRPDFQITPRNSVAISGLCRRLDGLPLAIELAAASIRLLTPAQMLERLMVSIDLPHTERRELSPRHRSLRAVMDESCRLLPDSLRQFFSRLSVFRGGWDLDAAQAAFDEPDALELLDMLQGRSLVVSRDTPDGMRFHLLETIRGYGESLLPTEEMESLREAHAAYFLDLGVRMASALNGPRGDAAADRLDTESENLRAAFDFVIPRDPQRAVHASAALWRFWYARGYAREGYRILSQAIRQAESRELPLDTAGFRDSLAAAHHGAGRLALSEGDAVTAAAHFNAARALCDAAEAGRFVHLEPSILAMDQALAAQAIGDYEETANAYRRLFELYRDSDDLWARSYALSSLAGALESSGAGDEAGERRVEAARLRALLGVLSPSGAEPDGTDLPLSARDTDRTHVGGNAIALTFLQLGHVAAEQGDDAAALGLFFDALKAYRNQRDDSGSALVQERIALSALRQEDIPTARRAVADALSYRRDVGGASEDVAERFARALLARVEHFSPGNDPRSAKASSNRET